MWDRLKKDWQVIKKKGLSGAEASAEMTVEASKEESGDQLNKDMTELTPMERKAKIQKVFTGE